MKYKLFIVAATVAAEFLIALVILMNFGAFAAQPNQLLILTNSLLLVIVLVQLYTVNILISIYEKVDGRKK